MKFLTLIGFTKCDVILAHSGLYDIGRLNLKSGDLSFVDPFEYGHSSPLRHREKNPALPPTMSTLRAGSTTRLAKRPALSFWRSAWSAVPGAYMRCNSREHFRWFPTALGLPQIWQLNPTVYSLCCTFPEVFDRTVYHPFIRHQHYGWVLNYWFDGEHAFAFHDPRSNDGIGCTLGA